ncbi:MAG: hypothetical protein Q4F65_01110 [Propionibacteriaceae bacterium]|nr:hypothetical protein [Propionibacteriaceae bacterium]
MASPVRLFGRLTLQRRGARKVESVRVRIECPVPTGAVARITDTQLQPGRFVTGWTLHPSDLGVAPVGGWSWRNAVVGGRRQLVVAADVASASPTVWDMRGHADAVRVGQYQFGPVAGSARVDGRASTATQGAGIPPHLTARADVDVDADVTGGRVLACCWFRGLSVPDDLRVVPPGPPPHRPGPVTASHPAWWQVLPHHDTWADVCAAHPDWS